MRLKTRLATLVLAVVGFAGTPAVAHAQATVYASIPTGCLGGEVWVLDATSRKTIARIPIEPLPAFVVASPDGSRVYVRTNTFVGDCGAAFDTVEVIDTSSQSVIASIPVGAGWTGPLAVSPDGSRLYAGNNHATAPGGNSISVIDTATNKVIDTVTGTPVPQTIGASPTGTFVYVANFNLDHVQRLNTRRLTLGAKIPVGDQPRGMTFAADTGIAYVVNWMSSDVSVIDPDSGPVATIGVGTNPAGADVSPDGRMLFVSNFNGRSVTSIDTASNSVVGTVNLGGNSTSDVAFAPAGEGREAWATADLGLIVLDTRNPQPAVIARVKNSMPASGIVIVPPPAARRIGQLQGAVDALRAAGKLNPGQAKALRRKLDQALTQLNKSKTQAAIKRLRAFAKLARKLITKGNLDVADGDPLVTLAAAIARQLA